MRLICGFVRLDGASASREQLGALAAALNESRRTPAVSLWNEGPAALAVLDFAATTAAPLPVREGQVCAADVRLDEPEELARSLGASKGSPDALLQLAYTRGRLAEVLGDFAFAHWDAATGTLACARDALGVRPLTYAHVPGSFFVFASLPAPIYRAGFVRHAMDLDAFVDNLTLNSSDNRYLVRGIFRLPPAHLLTVSRRGLAIEPYWSLDFAGVGKNAVPREQSVAELRRLIERAVECRLPERGEIGAHLSGGLDSSAVTLLAARALRKSGRRLHSYSFVDRQRDDVQLQDERPFVRAALARDESIDSTLICPPTQRLRPPPAALERFDQGQYDTPDGQVCVRAESQGVDLILSGWGGDEGASYNGRDALDALFWRGRWATLWKEARHIGRMNQTHPFRVIASQVLVHSSPRLSDFIGRLTGGGRPVRAFERHMPFHNPALRRARRGLERRHHRFQRARTLSPRGNVLAQGHFDWRCEHWARMGALHGIAFAFPLMDRRVLEFALSLPSDYYVRDGVRRAMFRDAMADILPEPILTRDTKYVPFPSNPFDVLAMRDELLQRLERYSTDPRVAQLFDVAAIRAALEGFPTYEQLKAVTSGNRGPEVFRRMSLAAIQVLRCEMLYTHGDSSAVANPQSLAGS